jgi:hypothetical protein
MNGGAHSDSSSSTDPEEERFDQVMSLKAPELKPWMQKFSNPNSSFDRVSQVIEVETGKRGAGRQSQVSIRSEHSMGPTTARVRRRQRLEKRIRSIESSLIHGRLFVEEREMADVDLGGGRLAPRSRQYRLSSVNVSVTVNGASSLQANP